MLLILKFQTITWPLSLKRPIVVSLNKDLFTVYILILLYFKQTTWVFVLYKFYGIHLPWFLACQTILLCANNNYWYTHWVYSILRLKYKHYKHTLQSSLFLFSPYSLLFGKLLAEKSLIVYFLLRIKPVSFTLARQYGRC